MIKPCLLLFVILPLFAVNLTTTPIYACSIHSSSSSSVCPPFTSPLSFPFSSSSGCGHPNFQIHCSFPHSIITINNLSFTILHYDPNSTSLSLSYLPSLKQSIHLHQQQQRSLCSSSLPNRSIDLSNTPFSFLNISCNKLSLVRHCSSPPLHIPNCSLCSWECQLLKTPLHLLQGCQPIHNQQQQQQVCNQQVDILSNLNNFLKLGFQVGWNEQDNYFSNCKTCQSQNGVCGFNSSDPRKKFLCYPQQAQPIWIRRDNPNRIVLVSTIFICTCVLLLLGTVTLIYYRVRFRGTNVNEEDPTRIMLFLHRHCSANLLPPVFSYQELESSTNRFDPRRKIGDGGFGSVYLGQLYDGRIVAVKRLHIVMGGRAFSTKSFCNEILILSSIHHPNLVKLHGYCSDPKGLLLVYDYVPNGTLADHLHGSNKTLLYTKEASLKSWQVRLDIALQIAMALEYLHFSVEPAIVHRDITSSNIFVEKDMRIKVGDFGLSRLLIYPDSSSSSSCGGYICTGPQGTPGYLDPDYHRSFRLTEKSDVYSFGVVLFELISGMKAVDLSRDKREVSLADMLVSKIQVGSLDQVVDPVLQREDARGTVEAVAELAFRCVAADKDDRPDAREVVAELKRIRSRVHGGAGNRSCSSNVVPLDDACKA